MGNLFEDRCATKKPPGLDQPSNPTILVCYIYRYHRLLSNKGSTKVVETTRVQIVLLLSVIYVPYNDIIKISSRLSIPQPVPRTISLGASNNSRDGRNRHNHNRLTGQLLQIAHWICMIKQAQHMQSISHHLVRSATEP